MKQRRPAEKLRQVARAVGAYHSRDDRGQGGKVGGMDEADRQVLQFLYQKDQQKPRQMVSAAELRGYLNAQAPNLAAAAGPALARLVDSRQIGTQYGGYWITPAGVGALEHPGRGVVGPRQTGGLLILLLIGVAWVGLCGLMLGSLNARRIHSVADQAVFPSPEPNRFSLLALGSMLEEGSDRPLQTQALAAWPDTLENFNTYGIPFELTPQSVVIETESQHIQNGARLRLPVNLTGVARFHLLLNLDYASPKWTGGRAVAGQLVGRLTVVAQDGWTATRELKAGQDVRDWFQGDPAAVFKVNEYVRPAWLGHAHGAAEPAALDYFVLELPPELQDRPLSHLLFEDLSREQVGHANPGLVIFGVVAEQR